MFQSLQKRRFVIFYVLKLIISHFIFNILKLILKVTSTLGWHSEALVVAATLMGARERTLTAVP